MKSSSPCNFLQLTVYLLWSKFQINNKAGNLTKEQIDVAMQGAPKVDDSLRQMEVTLVESPEFKVNLKSQN